MHIVRNIVEPQMSGQKIQLGSDADIQYDVKDVIGGALLQ